MLTLGVSLRKLSAYFKNITSHDSSLLLEALNLKFVTNVNIGIFSDNNTFNITCAIELSELLLHLTQLHLAKRGITKSVTKDRDKNQSKTRM